MFVIYTVVYGNKAYAALFKQYFRVVTYHYVVTTEPRHIFYYYRSHTTAFNIFKHSLKIRSVKVCTAVSVVHIIYGI